MLQEKFSAVAERSALQRILAFFDGKIYPAVYAVLALLSSVLGGEIPLFIVTALAIVFVCLFAKDTRSILVPLVFVMFGMSWKHTPQPPYRSDFLTQTYFYVILGVLGALVLAAFLFRLIVWRGAHNFFKEKSAFKWGLIALCAALLLNGAFFAGYVPSDLLLGALFAFSFLGMYIFFFNTLEERKGLHLYAAYLLTLACAVIFLQIVYILLFGGVVENGSINKDFFVSGWGMSNNIGGYLAFFLPACFYCSVKVRRGWILYVLGFVFFGAIVFTQSRTAILVGGIAVVCMAVYLSIVKSPQRKFIRIFNLVCLAAVIVGATVLWEEIVRLFAVIFDRGFDDSDRFFIWESGLKNFLRAPVFGVGFYEPIAPDWSYNIENWLFPDMYHNLLRRRGFSGARLSFGAAGDCRMQKGDHCRTAVLRGGRLHHSRYKFVGQSSVPRLSGADLLGISSLCRARTRAGKSAIADGKGAAGKRKLSAIRKPHGISVRLSYGCPSHSPFSDSSFL